MNMDTVALLTSARGWSLLSALPGYDEKTAVPLGESLREAGYEPELVAAALTQSRLRARGRAKFGEFANGMLFTPDGLEQATRLEIAARHAARFAQAGVRQVYDLGCGIGADAMALAALDLAVIAVDSDPATATIAGINLRHFPNVRTLVALAEEVRLPDGGRTGDGQLAGAWFDPARRVTTSTDASGRPRRLTSLEAISPPFSFVESVAARVPATGAKMAPGFPPTAVPAGAEAQWTSLRGVVLECALWWGPLATRPGRSAVVLGGTGPVLVTEADAAPLTQHARPGAGPGAALGPVAAGLPAPGTYLYEPDRAVIAAGLVGALTVAADGAELSHGVGYVVSGQPVQVQYATRYVVTHSMRANAKSVRAWLRAQGAGRLTLKRRGGRIDPDVFRARLHLDGRGDHITAILTTAGSTPAFIAVEQA